MSPEHLVTGVYLATLSALGLFGLHRVWMIARFRWHERDELEPMPEAAWPAVTVQLPLYDERTVAARLVRAAGALDYPRDRLEIQVLDDSDDETRAIVDAEVGELRRRGLDASVLRRSSRAGFKAGALAHGLARARGELVAVFDADFVPRPDFLRRLVPAFRDAGIGMVQARWEHRNRDETLFTRAQATLLDGHFVIENTVRFDRGLFFNFNGTAGIWRRTAIESAGGWQHDTLTEDLDLSYRAQLAGWRFVYAPHVTAPAEVPSELGAFQAQQHRWAKGSVQTCLKLLPRVLAARLPLHIKVESAFHLTANFAYPLMLLLSVLMFPAMVIRYNMGLYEMLIVDVPLFMGATLSVCSFYLQSQKAIFERDWKSRLKYLPAVLSVGIGISVNNAKAVLEALLGIQSGFRRTPKYHVEGITDEWKTKRYKGALDFLPFVELALAVYFGFMAWYALTNDIWGTLPFILIFQAGFLYAAGLSLFQNVATLAMVREQEA
jgi:cellulose synthase/poly-beta-1,6-N-acetylglucosamine synthase-like glycosyltransferase